VQLWPCERLLVSFMVPGAHHLQGGSLRCPIAGHLFPPLPSCILWKWLITCSLTFCRMERQFFRMCFKRKFIKTLLKSDFFTLDNELTKPQVTKGTNNLQICKCYLLKNLTSSLQRVRKRDTGLLSTDSSFHLPGSRLRRKQCQWAV
jgi:hypothetical protein